LKIEGEVVWDLRKAKDVSEYRDHVARLLGARNL